MKYLKLLIKFLIGKESPKSTENNALLEKTSKNAKVAVFAAGLGDVIRVIYKSGSYKYISEASDPVHVIVASHNPFAVEIFRFHHNARNFVIYDFTHKLEEFMKAGLKGPDVTNALINFAGLEHANFIRGEAAKKYMPKFDAPDNIDSDGHIVFQPFAGNSSRTFDEKFTEQIVEALRTQPKKVYLVTRNYIRKGVSGKIIHAEEDARRFAGGNIELLENLSVPATLNLVKRCSAYVGSWSSLQQAAWFENKPVAVFYPENYVDVVNRTGYAFGIDREDCHHCEFPSADMEKFAEWLRCLQ